MFLSTKESRHHLHPSVPSSLSDFTTSQVLTHARIHELEQNWIYPISLHSPRRARARPSPFHEKAVEINSEITAPPPEEKYIYLPITRGSTPSFSTKHGYLTGSTQRSLPTSMLPHANFHPPKVKDVLRGRIASGNDMLNAANVRAVSKLGSNA